MAFRNPILGGSTLLRAAIQSPNFVSGATGWSINRDGSAQFNNLTLRGTFVGADYVQNASGEFAYSGTPAAGNLIGSIAPAAGTDAYGNAYLAGFTSYGSGLFAQMVGGKLVVGAIAAGVPDTADAGGLYTDVAGVITQLLGISTATGATTNPPTMELFAGDINQTTGSTGAPQIILSDVAGNSAADFYISGTLVKTNDISSRYIWHAPTLATGYTNVNCQYRLNALDELHWQGEIGQNTAQTAAGSATVFTLTGAYVVKKETIVPASWRSSTGVAKSSGNAYFAFETSGAVVLVWSGATAAGDRFSCAVDVGLNNVP